jgi:hypothetical protein
LIVAFATDAERDDDKGISSQPREQGECEAFPFASYELEDLPKDGGDIQVKPRRWSDRGCTRYAPYPLMLLDLSRPRRRYSARRAPPSIA